MSQNQYQLYTEEVDKGLKEASYPRFISYYGGFPQQKTALTWLQGQARAIDGLMWQFARKYRDSEDGSEISLISVFEFYEELPHQSFALKWLEDQLPDSILLEFKAMWRDVPSPAVTPSLPEWVDLPLVWSPQTDSRYPSQADRMCFSSSVWMIAEFMSPVFKKRFRTDDDYLRFLHDNFGDTTNSQAHVNALRSLGLNAVFCTSLNLAQAINYLQQGIPIAIGFLHRGSHYAPTGGGHYAALKGFSRNRNEFICHDPFGSVMNNYSGAVTQGRDVWYPRWVLNNRWTIDRPGIDDKSGWGLIVLPD